MKRKTTRPQPSPRISVVRGRGGTPDPITTLSEDEQARMLGLADVALHNDKPVDSPAQAGDRARREHERLKRELREAVDRFEQQRKNA